MKKGIIAKVRETVPLIHNITNYVTVNDGQYPAGMWRLAHYGR